MVPICVFFFLLSFTVTVRVHVAFVQGGIEQKKGHGAFFGRHEPKESCVY